MNALVQIDPKMPNALRHLLELATKAYGKPAVSGYTPALKTFPALFFGFDDLIILQASDKKNVYVRMRGLPVKIIDGREFDADPDKMCAYAEQYIAKPHRANRDDLRKFERHFSTAARWTAAVVRQTRINALGALNAERVAGQLDRRAALAGM